jgi:crotonobetainyl-CoA:carnitine CoA-transferase CaiB-like acyl-CoA transferase
MSLLEGLSVGEFGAGAAAAYCSKLLLQLGAEVTKLVVASEPRDFAEAELRRQARALYFDHGKRIVESGEAGWLDRMAQMSPDIVVRGFEPAQAGAAERVRAEYAALRARRPDTIYVALTPFGLAPDPELNGGSLQAQAVSGWMWMNGEPAEAPLSVAYDACAVQHGLHGVGAALAAVLARGQHGHGDLVDISEAHVTAAMVRNYVSVYRWNRIPMQRAGTRAPGSSGRYPHAAFPAKDGLVIVMARSEIEWDRLLQMMGDPEWAANPRYRDFYAMATEYPEELDALFAPWIAAHTVEELVRLSGEHGVALAPVRSVVAAQQDVQFKHRDFFDQVEIGPGRYASLPGLPARLTFSGAGS